MTTITHIDFVTNTLLGLQHSVKRRNEFSQGFTDALGDLVDSYIQHLPQMEKPSLLKKLFGGYHEERMTQLVPLAQELIENPLLREDHIQYEHGYIAALNHIILSRGLSLM